MAIIHNNNNNKKNNCNNNAVWMEWHVCYNLTKDMEFALYVLEVLPGTNNISLGVWSLVYLDWKKYVVKQNKSIQNNNFAHLFLKLTTHWNVISEIYLFIFF